MLYHPRLVMCEESCRDDPWASALLASCAGIEVQHGSSVVSPDAGSVHILVIETGTGAFISDFQCTTQHVGNGLRILDLIRNCTLGCAYCILRGLDSDRAVRLRADRNLLFRELNELDAVVTPGQGIRVCPGEWSDSLLLEDRVPIVRDLVACFSHLNHLVLEVKTKTTLTGMLPPPVSSSRTVLSWSLNPPEVHTRFEPATESPWDRIDAACAAAHVGYPIAFHFDPIILEPGLEDAYLAFADQLIERMQDIPIMWISLGCLRFTTRAFRELGPGPLRAAGLRTELLPGPDGKLCTFRPHRIWIYRHLYERFTHAWPNAVVYLCMETPDVWKAVTGTAETTESLTERMDTSARNCCAPSRPFHIPEP